MSYVFWLSFFRVGWVLAGGWCATLWFYCLALYAKTALLGPFLLSLAGARSWRWLLVDENSLVFVPLAVGWWLGSDIVVMSETGFAPSLRSGCLTGCAVSVLDTAYYILAI